jgi:hypothetical protein
MSEETFFDSHWMQGMYLFSTVFTQVVRHTQPPIQWVLKALSPGVKWVGHEPDTHPYLAPKLRMSEAIALLPTCLEGMHTDNFTFTILFHILFYMHMNYFCGLIYNVTISNYTALLVR